MDSLEWKVYYIMTNPPSLHLRMRLEYKDPFRHIVFDCYIDNDLNDGFWSYDGYGDLTLGDLTQTFNFIKASIKRNNGSKHLGYMNQDTFYSLKETLDSWIGKQI